MFAETKSVLNKFNIDVSSFLMSSLRAIAICQKYFGNHVISSQIHLFAPLLNMRRCTLWYAGMITRWHVIFRIHPLKAWISGNLSTPTQQQIEYIGKYCASVCCLYKEVYLQIFKCVYMSFWLHVHGCCREWGGGPVNRLTTPAGWL